MIIQIIGLPGSGKTTLAKELKEHINAIHLNADEVRSTINIDLGFDIKDRVEHARRLGEIARLISSQGFNVIVDFICPTKETRNAFGKPDYIIWMDRIEIGRFEDTNKLWEKPEDYDIRIVGSIGATNECKMIIDELKLFDWKAPTTLQLGRYQPWHEGHQALKEEAHKRTEQVLVGVRNTQGTSEKDPLSFDQVKHFISKDNNESNTLVLRLPNITNIVYGRDVGYKIEQVELSQEIQSISATQKRKEMGI